MKSDEIARLIVEDIMVNGAGWKAARLVLRSADDTDIGGWGRVPLESRIAAILAKELDEKE